MAHHGCEFNAEAPLVWHAGLSEGANPLQLRDVAALLRKSDDHNAVLKGLAALGPLVDVAPHELDSYAGNHPSRPLPNN